MRLLRQRERDKCLSGTDSLEACVGDARNMRSKPRCA
jgi:hypothetical protein